MRLTGKIANMKNPNNARTWRMLVSALSNGPQSLETLSNVAQFHVHGDSTQSGGLAFVRYCVKLKLIEN